MAGKGKTGPAPVKQASLDPHEEDILRMMTEGRGMRYIAAQHKVGVATLFAWCEANPERSKLCNAAMERASVAEDEAALDAIESAQTPFELSKAHEIAIHRRWRAKALAPKRYGDRQQVDLNAKVEIDIAQVDERLSALLAKAG